MGEQMTFPNTFKEFAELYKTIDTKEVYSNGIEFIPIFRVEQWLEYISTVEMATFKSVIDSLEKQLKTAKAEAYKECIEKVEKIICENTYPSFDKDGKAVNIWKATTGYDELKNLLKEMVGEDNA